MNKDEIFKEADKIIDKHKSKQLNKPVVSDLLLTRSLSLLEEMMCERLHFTDWNGKCFKCGKQVFVREPK